MSACPSSNLPKGSAEAAVHCEQAERAKAKAALEAERRAQDEATIASKRQRQVEAEMRALLTSLERQKAASAAKVKQLASAIQDLQGPYLSPGF